MEFGFTLKPDHDIKRSVALTRQAEAAGFTYGWVFDNHLPFREVYPLLTLMAMNTTHMRLGTCVTNPATRDPSVTASALATLNEVSGGRMDLGIGRGDSSVRSLGRPPTTMKVLEEALVLIRDLVEGRTVVSDGMDLALPWTGASHLPTWVAGYGPMALGLAGRIADGLILQLADPDLVRWMVGMMRAAAVDAGRDPATIAVQAAAPAHVGSVEACREHVRWFPAAVSGHVVELVNRYPSDQVPASLTAYVRDNAGHLGDRRDEFGASGASFVTDDVVDRFTIIGPAEAHVEKLGALADAGVTQFNLYLMSGDEEAQLDAYGSSVIPAMRAAANRNLAGRP